MIQQDEAMIDKFKGCLMGLAIGDALGATLEFSSRKDKNFTPINDIIGKGPHKLKAGQWTDDTR